MKKNWFKKALFLIAGLFLLSSCTLRAQRLKPGTYEGSGQGYDPETLIRLSVTIDETGSVYDLKILQHKETPEIGGKALDQLRQEAIEKNGDKVDTVSGATRTSEGFRQSVKNALDASRQAEKESGENR